MIYLLYIIPNGLSFRSHLKIHRTFKGTYPTTPCSHDIP